MSGDPERIGLVDGSVDSNSRTFHVVLDADAVIQLDELVTVSTALPDRREVTHYGIVTELLSRFEGADLPSDTGRVIDRTLPAELVRRAEVRVLRVVPELIETGRYVPPQLGIEINYNLNRSLLRRGTTGVLVVDVTPGTGAAEAGLRGIQVERNQLRRLGDIIQGIDGEPVRSPAEMRAVLDRYQVGDEVTVTILRDGQERELVIRLS